MDAQYHAQLLNGSNMRLESGSFYFIHDLYEKIKGSYILNRSVVESASKVVTVMHHLPRVGELDEDVDSYPGAAYFRQPFNGVLVRAALLAILLDRVA